MSDPLTYALACLKRATENGYPWSVSPAEAATLVAEVERLRAEVSYLRACVPPVHPGDYGHEAWVEGGRAAVKAERAAVVAYLAARGGICLDLANDIERGEHLHAEEP